MPLNTLMQIDLDITLPKSKTILITVRTINNSFFF